MFFIPKKIKVGYQNRPDTYTNKLAYIIYYDDKGTLRKETSWQGWRNQKIEPDDIDNVPTSGFVLNKTAGGRGYSSWDTRKTYCRVYDPRGFEFEIDISNLLYLLENTNSIVGKGLEGEFVYGWEGKELVLIPTSAPDYANNKKKSDMMFNAEFVKAKELVPGVIYTKKNGEQLMYLGKDIKFENAWGNRYDMPGGETIYRYEKMDKNQFWFFNVNRELDDVSEYSYSTYASLPKMYKPEENVVDSRYAKVLQLRDSIGTYNPIIEVEYKQVTPYDLTQSLEKADYVYNIDNYWQRSDKAKFVVKQGDNERDVQYALPYDDYYLERNPLKFYKPLDFINTYNLRKLVKTVRYADKK